MDSDFNNRVAVDEKENEKCVGGSSRGRGQEPPDAEPRFVLC